MDVIRTLAKEFNNVMYDYVDSLSNYDGELNSQLLYISDMFEKLRFLSYLRDMVESDYQEHAKVCRSPDDCRHNRAYEIALYSIKQQYNDYSQQAGISSDDSEKPAMQFFSNGQYFDAFTAIKECVKEAKSSIILVDNYVDAHTLAFFPSKEPSIKLRILTLKRSITSEFERAIDLYNKQYQNLMVRATDSYHDRFLIVDEKSFYHIGASIKDAGKKAFMFSKIDDSDIHKVIMDKIRKEWGDIL